MHVALIASMAWLDEELASYRSLVAGLLEAQTRITQVLPEELPDEHASAFAPAVRWHDAEWAMQRRRRLGQLAPSLAHQGVNLVHALDGRAWKAGLDLARKLNVPVVLGLHDADDLARVPRLKALDSQAVVAAATAPLAAALERDMGARITVEIVPPAVHLPANPRPVADPRESFCIVISGEGEADADYDALFSAVHEIAAQPLPVQLFVDTGPDDPHEVWLAARKRQLLSRLTLVPPRPGRRDILLSADVLVHPQPLGRTRSLTLAAMAHGLPVIARGDAWLDYLIDDQTAWLVEPAGPLPWIQMLERAMNDAPAAAALGRRARGYIAEHHRLTGHIDALLHLYRRATGQTLRFPDPV